MLDPLAGAYEGVAAAHLEDRLFETLKRLLAIDATSHSWPLERALAAISAEASGVAVLLNCAEPADALFAQLRQAGDDDAQASVRRRSGKLDLRTYGIGAQILKDLGVGRMRLLSHPRKMPSMTGFDLEVAGFESDTQD